MYTGLARRVAGGPGPLFALVVVAVTTCALPVSADEPLRVPLPKLGAPVQLGLELAEYTVRGLRVSPAESEGGKPAYTVVVGVANPGAVPVLPALTVTLWAGRQWLATASFRDMAVPAEQSL
ncbi:MAG: hypothetical protein HPY69_20035, partial [Armatimonadetes bacterium]|nr:hypothetical protein [Armatimonadota bacterium]